MQKNVVPSKYDHKMKIKNYVTRPNSHKCIVCFSSLRLNPILWTQPQVGNWYTIEQVTFAVIPNF